MNRFRRVAEYIRLAHLTILGIAISESVIFARFAIDGLFPNLRIESTDVGAFAFH